MPHTATRVALSVACASLAVLAGAATPATDGAFGFTDQGARDQHALERKFDAQLHAEDLRDWMKSMSSAPNQVGSPHDRANAEFMLEKFRSWGWDAQIETFSVLYPTLKSHTLEMVAPTRFTASLTEPPIAGDATSSQTADVLAPYTVYGADGDVTADLVYVNFGMPDDYKELDRRGISVKGRIAIARYGAGWRGLKPKLAWEHGAVGCIIYSDPHEDGFRSGDVYPKGGTRPAHGVQRGSVADMPIYPGDPLTPDVGATKGARRLSIADAKTVLKIPVMPISYADAKPLLDALGGEVVPENWQGALPITYHFGPGPAKVHLAVASDWTRKPVYDVIAKMRGSEAPDQWIIRGNHHDGWVFGAWDPLAGNVALMEEAKAIGALVKQGWKPKRTLVYASWDGEEPGLLGSTEWAEAHADELRHKAVVYVNSDTNARGFLFAEGSHSLQHLVNQVAEGIRDPETGVSVSERQRAAIEVRGFARSANATQQKLAKKVAKGGDLPIGALGSGSDYSAFLQHLGIASLNLGYGGEDEQSGVYHSRYDSFDHYLRFGDPDFAYGVVLAQTAGHVMLRMADAALLPLRFSDFADTVGRYVGELHQLADSERERTETQARLLDQRAFELAADPTRHLHAPAREIAVPYLDFAPLDNAVARLKDSAKAYDEACAQAIAAGGPFTSTTDRQVNRDLQAMEQALLDPDGLPGREWYRHMIYAPGLLTGYGVKTLPGVREAIEEHAFDRANHYSGVIAKALDTYSEKLDKAAALLGNAKS
ncbi:MAG TPA: transferrin receptor-like dimerization domain-containing protein [Rhodanobacteraceae bacterium]|nr:transferrin receptor-like dimerization domain-containing protein [Rhodanobacteraceae bacterium]